MNDTQWLIWSLEHEAWWGLNEMGYVGPVQMAGVYSYEDATRIVCGANRNLDIQIDREDYQEFKDKNIPNEAMILLTPELKLRLKI